MMYLSYGDLNIDVSNCPQWALTTIHRITKVRAKDYKEARETEWGNRAVEIDWISFLSQWIEISEKNLALAKEVLNRLDS